jgi:hypothetical protein
MIDPDGGFAFPEKNGTAVGQMHTDADGSWAWNGSNWQGQGSTPDFYFLNEVIVGGGARTGGGQLYGGNGSGSFLDYFHRFVFETDQYNPIALAWDGMSGYISGKDRYGNSLSGTQSTVKMLSAIPITKAGGVLSSVVSKAERTIVGEGMKRVSAAAAQESGAVILNNMPKFAGTASQVTSQMMTYNRQWLLQQMRSGRPILDIGLDPARGVPSIFYQMEQNMMKNYLKLHPNAFQIIK